MTESNYNAVRFTNFFLPEFYITTPVSIAFFTTLFMLMHYVLIPKLVHPHFEHIRTNLSLQHKIAEDFVSMTHGMLILVLCITFHQSDHHILFLIVTREITSSFTTYEVRILASVSIGYFIYDSIVEIWLNGIQNIYILHHVVGIMLLTVPLISVYGGHMIIVGLFYAEITNPILHVNGLKNKFTPIESQKRSKRFIMYNIIIKSFYLFTYCVARLAIGGYMLYQILFVYPTNIYIQIAVCVSIVLSIILLPMNIKNITKSYSNYKDISTKSSTLSNSQLETVPNIETQYDHILHLSKTSVCHYMFAGSVYSFIYSNRMSIYVLYADEFNPDFVEIAVLLYTLHFWSGLASLLYSTLANGWCYDKATILVLFLQFIGILLESVSQSFYMLFAGAIIAQVAITYVVFGYIAWILPHEHAAAYTAYFYGAFVVSYLIGPLSAGFVSFYLSNRAMFIIDAVLCFVPFIHGLMCILNTQKKLEEQQLLVGLCEDEENDKQFPVCLNIALDKQTEGEQNESKWCKLPQMSSRKWFMIICILFVNSTPTIAETTVVVYYGLYVVEVLNENIIIGTCGIFVMSLGFIIGNLMIPKWCKLDKESTKHSSKAYLLIKNKYFVVIVSLILEVFLTLYLFPSITSLSFYWLFDSACGLALGTLSMASEIILLEIQPPKDSGKINGAKGLIRNWLSAAVMFVIAIYWEQDPNSFWYANGCMFGAALILSLVIVVVAK